MQYPKLVFAKCKNIPSTRCFSVFRRFLSLSSPVSVFVYGTLSQFLLDLKRHKWKSGWEWKDEGCWAATTLSCDAQPQVTPRLPGRPAVAACKLCYIHTSPVLVAFLSHDFELWTLSALTQHFSLECSQAINPSSYCITDQLHESDVPGTWNSLMTEQEDAKMWTIRWFYAVSIVVRSNLVLSARPSWASSNLKLIQLNQFSHQFKNVQQV